MRSYLAISFVAVAAALLFWPGSAVARDAPAPTVIFALPSVDREVGWLEENGTASYYGRKQKGHVSASGLRFDPRLLTAAHAWLPFGTRVRVTLGETGRSVVVVITDRLYSSRRVVDLSAGAARALGIVSHGLAKVTLAPD